VQGFYARLREEKRADQIARARDKRLSPIATEAMDLVQEALLKDVPAPVQTRLEDYSMQLGDMVRAGKELSQEAAHELAAYITEHTQGH
jgi:hypothetical protein